MPQASSSAGRSYGLTQGNGICYSLGIGSNTRTARSAMNVTLSPQLEALVRSKVASGRYSDANAVIMGGAIPASRVTPHCPSGVTSACETRVERRI